MGACFKNSNSCKNSQNWRKNITSQNNISEQFHNYNSTFSSRKTISDINTNYFHYFPRITEGIKRDQDTVLQEGIYYQGEWRQEKFEGVGRIFNAKEKQSIFGNFHEGKLLTNHCVKVFSTGNIYIGHLDESYNMSGQGMLIRNNMIYIGNFFENKMHGFGTIYLGNNFLEGMFNMNSFISGKQVGENQFYKGSFENYQRNGQGTLTSSDGIRYEGKFKDNMKNGKGKQYSSSDKLIRKGVWKNDQFLLFN